LGNKQKKILKEASGGITPEAFFTRHPVKRPGSLFLLGG
jgi:hypothetical protein